MQQRQGHLRIATAGRGFTDITAAVAEWLRQQKARQGLLTVFLRHTSASLLIQENADPDVLRDLDAFFARLAPDDPGLYRHVTEGPDDMPAHIRSSLTQTHLAVPVGGGRLELGTWQAIFLFEHRQQPHQRELVLHFIGD
jgi:secondary thiamine-phosphate synthase enzyme